MAKYSIDTTGTEIVQALGDNAAGKTLLITGPSAGGLGAETAKTLAAANPSHLLLVGRNKAKIAPVIDEINRTCPKVKVTYVQCELANMASVREAAAHINSLVDKIHVHINNAGTAPVREFKKSVDGIEMQFAANYLGHYLLTNLIIDKLIATKGVIICMTSLAYGLAEANTKDPNFNDGKDYAPWKAYGQAKTSNILFSVALASKFGNKGVTSFAVEPGHVNVTAMGSEVANDLELTRQAQELVFERSGKQMRKHVQVSLQQGCATAILVALDTSLKGSSPSLYRECATIPVLPYANDKVIADDLWKLSEYLVGQTFEAHAPGIITVKVPRMPQRAVTLEKVRTILETVAQKVVEEID